jgi:uncharacterized repeat protein (TIGR03803 family)
LTVLLALALLTLTAGVQAQTYSTLYRFTGANGDGAIPYGITGDAAGNLYGFTFSGGAGFGTIYKLDPAGNETVLYTFTGQAEGTGPQGAPVLDAAGNLYGVTMAGGSLFDGTIFKLDAAGNFSVLYNLAGQSRAGLTADAAGNLYGTLFVDSTNSGSVYKFDTAGSFTTLHSFGSSPTDGVNPTARVTLDSAGNLYGTTENGGSGQHGTVFKIDTAGNYSILHNFSGPDGESMEGGVTLDGAGNIFGTTFDGGANGVGTIFKIDAAGNFTSLHSMDCGLGCQPLGELVRDASGNLYGVTISGGGFGLGSVFKSDASGNVTQLFAFTNAVTDGNRPGASLLQDSAGVLYGTTLSGGSASNDGTVFKLVLPSGHLDNFTALVGVSRERYATAVAGQFHPVNAVNPLTQSVTLSVAGNNSASVTFAPGSFKKVGSLYSASGKIGVTKITLLLAPLNNGNWGYAAALTSFVPGTPSVTVSLTIGAQNGSATVTAHLID